GPFAGDHRRDAVGWRLSCDAFTRRTCSRRRSAGPIRSRHRQCDSFGRRRRMARRAAGPRAAADRRATYERRHIGRCRRGCSAAGEVTLGIGVVAIVGTLGMTVPAAHSPTIWTFSFTLHIESAPPYVSLVRAYPTTYATSPLRYTTAAIAQGAAVYAQNCAQCHAPHADHEAPTHMQHEAPDLSDHGTHHPPGDLFWWIAHGIAGTSMPAFSPRLSDT